MYLGPTVVVPSLGIVLQSGYEYTFSADECVVVGCPGQHFVKVEEPSLRVEEPSFPVVFDVADTDVHEPVDESSPTDILDPVVDVPSKGRRTKTSNADVANIVGDVAAP